MDGRGARGDRDLGCDAVYEVNDYTCVKDAVAMWLDQDRLTGTSDQPGCYRAVLGGRRFLGASPPPGDPLEQKRPEDPCHTYVGSANFLI